MSEHFLASDAPRKPASSAEEQALQEWVQQQALALHDERLYTIINQLPYRIAIKDADLKYVCCNRLFAEALGCRPADLIGKNDFDCQIPALAEYYHGNDRQVMRQGAPLAFDEPCRSGEETLWMHTLKAPIFDASGRIQGISVVIRDITEQKRAEEALMRRAWALQALRHSDKALMQLGTEQELLQAVCDGITAEGQYCLAWIGWADTDAQRSIAIVAAAGSARDYLQSFQVSWGTGAEGQGPAGRSLRSGQAEIDNDIMASPGFRLWQPAASRHAIGASMALPFQVEGRAGVLLVYARHAGAFAGIEVKLFEELAANLAFVLEARRTRDAYERDRQARLAQAAQLEKALLSALEAIAAVLEQRDPYTAGHQKQVANLAALIGRELGLEEGRLQALSLASVVHDIGKIQVPAEILVKPSRLNAAEFALVQRHPQAGYEILRRIAFPWPIADIVHQHHEYLDGSGYPQGLRGSQILLEARILTVADIVESMSSDRPYRAALPMAAAMEEIQRQRGSRLDEDVVDACLAVLRRGDFMPSILGRPE